MVVLEQSYPRWRELTIHESSPSKRGVSPVLLRECRGYVPSQYFEKRVSGEIVEGVRSENLEALSFADESIDLHITQDVLEHLLCPERAFSEIARTLKPGGAHVFTVPLVNKDRPSRRRAVRTQNGEVEFLAPPEYHSNPVSPRGSLVTYDWGYDICREIFNASGLFTHRIVIDDVARGIKGEFLDVLVSVK